MMLIAFSLCTEGSIADDQRTNFVPDMLPVVSDPCNVNPPTSTPDESAPETDGN